MWLIMDTYLKLNDKESMKMKTWENIRQIIFGIV